MARVINDPRDRLKNRLLDLERRVAALGRSRAVFLTFDGPRSDDPRGDGSDIGPRVRIGLLSDDSYGVERWLEDGTRETPTWV